MKRVFIMVCVRVNPTQPTLLPVGLLFCFPLQIILNQLATQVRFFFRGLGLEPGLNFRPLFGRGSQHHLPPTLLQIPVHGAPTLA